MQPDVPACGQGAVNTPGLDDGWSISGGHEYAEAITMPEYVGGFVGWLDPLDYISGGLIADKCVAAPSENVRLSTGSFAMQPLWSNAADACVMATYGFSGFLAPIRDPGSLNAGRAGATYPVKWQLTDAGGSYISSLGAVSSLTYTYTGATCSSDNSTGAQEAGAAGSTSLRYDSTSNQYVYDWKTPSTRGCYTLFINLSDGSTHDAYFHLK